MNLIKIMVVFLIFFNNLIAAQYRRRHADVTRELVRILREPKREDYYFALLPIDIQKLVAQIRYPKKAAVDKELKRVPESEKTPQFFNFLLYFPHLFGTNHLVENPDYCYKNINFIKAFVATAGQLSKIALSEVINYNSPDATTMVGILLRAGAHPQKIDERFNYPLVEAASKGLAECVELLLKAGADPNAHKEFGRSGITEWTPLMSASRKGFINIVRLLLHKRADVNYVGSFYELNALNVAVIGNHVDIVKLLLSEGADINYIGLGCGSSLQLAIEEGNIEMVQLLLEKGHDPNPQTVKAGCFKGRLKDCLQTHCPREKYAEVKSMLDRYS